MSSPDEYQVDSPKCVIRVPTAQIPKQPLHPIQEPKVVGQKDRKSEEADALSTRANSVPRPRAVLSSPDNDEMIGSKNNKRVIQPTLLRNHNMVQNRHVQCKIIPIQTTGTPTSSRSNPRNAAKDHTPSTAENFRGIRGNPKVVKDQKTPSKVRKSGIVASSQKAQLKTEKANSGIIRPGNFSAREHVS